MKNYNKIEIMKPDGRNIEATVVRILDENNTEVPSAPHPKQELYVELDADVCPMDILRVAKDDADIEITLE